MKDAHITTVRLDKSHIFGVTYQPVCAFDYGSSRGHYRGPFVKSPRRAESIGREHELKSAGMWRPAW